MVDNNNDYTCIKGEQFEKIFPFHFIINSSMKLIKCGKSMRKLFNFNEGIDYEFDEHFTLMRPSITYPTFEDLASSQDILIILEFRTKLSKIKLRGQFEYYRSNNTVLFIGTPWFNDISQLPAAGITMQDFAVYDTQLDLLQALNSQESVNSDIKTLLNKLSHQKKEIEKNAKLLKVNQSQLELLSKIAEQTMNGVVITDSKGKIEWVNKSFTKITGYHLDEIIGLSPGSFLQGAETDPQTVDYMKKCINRGEDFMAEIINYHKDGVPYWIKIDGHPIKNEKGEIIKFFALEEDITTRVKTEQALREAKEKADATSQAKDIFLANMSHEMRTPLNAILGMCNQMKKTNIDSEQRFFLETMNSAAEHLLVVINDILDISRIEAGKLQLECIDFDIFSLISHSIQVLSAKAEEKGLNFKMTLDESISKIIVGDPYRLNQILLNILNNAIKFTEKGGVSIEVVLLKDNEESQKLRFIIDDTGIGMDEKFLNSIFQKFTQEDSSIARKYGGTGLGLNITKQLVELMGGKITVKSIKNVGSLFLIDIEFPKGRIENIVVDKKVNLSSEILQNVKVLLVEDNEMNRILARTILKNFSAITTEAENGLKAIELLKEKEYDIVLMDIQMPVMGGYESTKIIRTELQLDIPIIALTANALKGEKEKCIEGGMNAYLSKPFKEDDLIKLMAELLNLDIIQNENTTYIDLMKDDLPQIDIPIYDLNYLKESFGDSPDAINSLLEAFLKEGELGILQITDYLESQDTEGLRATAHRLKANVAMLNAHRLYALASEIEAQARTGTFTNKLKDKTIEFKLGLLEIVSKLKLDVALV